MITLPAVIRVVAVVVTVAVTFAVTFAVTLFMLAGVVWLVLNSGWTATP